MVSPLKVLCYTIMMIAVFSEFSPKAAQIALQQNITPPTNQFHRGQHKGSRHQRCTTSLCHCPLDTLTYISFVCWSLKMLDEQVTLAGKKPKSHIFSLVGFELGPLTPQTIALIARPQPHTNLNSSIRWSYQVVI